MVQYLKHYYLAPSAVKSSSLIVADREINGEISGEINEEIKVPEKSAGEENRAPARFSIRSCFALVRILAYYSSLSSVSPVINAIYKV